MKRIWVNGVFDILHIGHVRLLNHAASLGTLIVGLNSDESTRALKGPSRPIYSQVERCDMLMALSSVSCVIIFDELTPVRAISVNLPIDIIVKGSDYYQRDFPEKHTFTGIEFVYFNAQTTRRSSEVLSESLYRDTTTRDMRARKMAANLAVCTCRKENNHPSGSAHESECAYRLWMEKP